ncbi:MAG: hypothetical protein J7513_01575 [Solirubrobacteraceae bacterium]|nr:hypothetical protein [Solirubrobacteraceae bacterium]
MQAALGLADDELCDALGLTPLQLLAGEADVLPQTQVLDQLLRAAAEQVQGSALSRWVRASGPAGCPLDHLLAQDYAAFEGALEGLLERGFVIRRRD